MVVVSNSRPELTPVSDDYLTKVGPLHQSLVDHWNSRVGIPLPCSLSWTKGRVRGCSRAAFAFNASSRDWPGLITPCAGG